jgi:hypothetical protein
MPVTHETALKRRWRFSAASARLQRGDRQWMYSRMDGERYPMRMRRMTAVLLAVAIAAGLSIGVGRRAQRFLSDLPIVDHGDAA